MNYASALSLAALAASFGIAPAVSAATIAHFELSGPTPSSDSSFDIALTPTVTSFTANSFEIDDVTTNLFSSVTGPYSETLDYTFYVANPMDYPTGGLTGRYYTAGDQLFSGPTSAPTFLPGLHYLYEPNSGDQFTVNITTSAVAAAPEPMTWAMLIVGLAAVGVRLRMSRSRQRVRLAYA